METLNRLTGSGMVNLTAAPSRSGASGSPLFFASVLTGSIPGRGWPRRHLMERRTTTEVADRWGARVDLGARRYGGRPVAR